MTKRFSQILHNKAHWIFGTAEKPEYAPNIFLVDITDKPDVQEGWDYDSETGEFTEPAKPEPMEVEPSINEKILIENQYQTALIEMQMMGGM